MQNKIDLMSSVPEPPEGGKHRKLSPLPVVCKVLCLPAQQKNADEGLRKDNSKS